MAQAVVRPSASVEAIVTALMAGSPPDRWSSMQGHCGFYAARMRKALAAAGSSARLAFVGGTGYHYHVRVSDHVMVCPTWLQWIDGEHDPALPRVFVGTRDMLVHLLEPYAAVLACRDGDTRKPPSRTPERLVDQQYGFGRYAGELRDAGVQERELLRRPPKEFLLSMASIDGH